MEGDRMRGFGPSPGRLAMNEEEVRTMIWSKLNSFLAELEDELRAKDVVIIGNIHYTSAEVINTIMKHIVVK
jgi:hypothetical protein